MPDDENKDDALLDEDLEPKDEVPGDETGIGLDDDLEDLDLDLDGEDKGEEEEEAI